MMSINSIKKQFYYGYTDVHRAFLCTFSCLLAVVVTQISGADKSFWFWLILSATLAALTIQGESKYQQTVNFIKYALLILCFITTTVFLHAYLSLFFFYLTLFFVLMGLLCIPKYISGTSGAVIFVAIYMVVTIDLTKTNTSLEITSLLYQFAGLIGGIFLCALVNLALPLSKVALANVDKIDYVAKRAFRTSFTVVFAFILANAVGLRHISWICITILAISRGNMGESIKRGVERLFGTALGVIVSIPVSIWLFSQYPLTRWLTLPILFLCMLMAKRYYFLSMLLSVLLISAVFYFTIPGNEGAISFIFTRLLDTAIGISIAFVAELLFFPKSSVESLRAHHRNYWDALRLYFLELQKENGKPHQYWQIMDQELIAHDLQRKEYKYEPLVYFRVRYHMLSRLFNKLHRFTNKIKSYADPAIPDSLIQSQYMSSLIKSTEQLQRFHQLSILEREAKAPKLYQQQLTTFQQLKRPLDDSGKEMELYKLNRKLLIITRYYKSLLSVSPKKMYWQK